MQENFVSTGGEEIASSPVSHPEIPRGVSLPILLEQIRNTVPYLMQPSSTSELPFVKRLRAAERNPLQELKHEAYFELCVCAHYATVASYVPTDVDNQIRFKLWHPRLPVDTLEAMANLVLSASHWDVSSITTRGISHPKVAGILSGHDGEWFSIAVGAYAILRRRSPELSQEIFQAILKELDRESQLLAHFLDERDGVSLLKAVTTVAHNLGDLDRVMEMWGLSSTDPLYDAAFKLGHEGVGRYQGLFFLAGQLNKAMMADENHRHFALRKPKCLRREVALLIPIGPFFDGWGYELSKNPRLSVEEIGEVAEALVDGWVWMAEQKGGGPEVPVGYARALAGMIEGFPGGLNGLANELPSRIAKTLKTGVLRSQCAVPRGVFEEKWASRALKFAGRFSAKSHWSH